MNKDNERILVIGAGYGDEGKGNIVNHLSDKDTRVCRYNGGHQAAHRVVAPIGTSHIFSSLGSGTFKGAITVIEKECTFDPMSFLIEYSDLTKKNIYPRLMIHPECQIVTPFDKVYNKTKSFVDNSTCASGFGATKKRVEETHYSLRFMDINYGNLFSEKYNAIKEYYKNILSEEEMKEANRSYAMFNMTMSTILMLIENKVILDYKSNIRSKIIYEGAQGILLDQEYGIFPYVTRSNVINTSYTVDSIALVRRAYTTKHSKGGLEHEDKNTFLKKGIEESNKDNNFQGNFRIAPLNITNLEYSLDILRMKYPHATIDLYITCLDQMEKYPYVIIDRYFEAKDEAQFVRYIKWVLAEGKYNLNKIFLSRSADSTKIEEYNG